MMNKINAIVDLINNCDTVVDVGSDHAYLSIELLKQNKVNKCFNIEINKEPLNNGILNLKKNKLLDKTENILNNGLENIELKITNNIDYCVIAGMGSANIVNILSKNKLDIKCYILQTNKNPYLLRKYLNDNNYIINKEYYIKESKYFYPIFVCIKTNCSQNLDYIDLYFGKKNSIINSNVYIEYLQREYELLEKKFSISNKSDYKKMYNLIITRLKEMKYED